MVGNPGSNRSATPALSEIAWVFLRLGSTAFGGPAAHVALMDDEIVRRRRWLTREQFVDYMGATNLIPGPNSTELAIHIGYARAGWAGLIVAGLAFIVPAVILVTIAAWFYVEYGALPQVTGLLYGVKPVVIAIVAQALWRLGRTALKTAGLAALTFIAVAAVAAGTHELIVLAAAALTAATLRLGSRPRPRATTAVAVVAAASSGGLVGAAGGAATAIAPFGLWPLFLVFAKVGSVLFGSGYVLLAFLQADLVERLGWITEQQLLDAIAIGQVTPGPVFTTATFVGYLLGGFDGAMVATIGIFLPAFIFVALSGPLVPRMRRSSVVGAILDGLNAASLALMAVVGWQLARAAVIDPLTVALACGSTLALATTRINSAWLVAAGAALGWAVTL
jgi:chromate transporter